MMENLDLNLVTPVNSAEIISVGTEILMGQIVNTNAAYIAGELSEEGIPSYYQTVVGDNPGRIEKALRDSLLRSDLVIMTGGLGPTADDISMAVAAKVMGVNLVTHNESLEKIQNYFSSINRKMTESNLKQALMPDGAIVLENDKGTAPGAIIEGKGTVILLPGPPSEMVPMFSGKVKPYLKKRSSMYIKSVYIRLFGIGESAAEERIRDIIYNQSNPTVAPYCTTGECMFRVSYSVKGNRDLISHEELNAIESKINTTIKAIEDKLGDFIYEIGDRTMDKVVFDLLQKKGLTVSFAESCTAGMLSSMIAGHPGASGLMAGSITAYSEKIKTGLLKVPENIIERYGAVSDKTAKEMAAGAKRLFGSDISVSVTGIAGPGGGTHETPTGLVYIGIYYRDKLKAKKLQLRGDRQKIRYLACLHALDMIRREISDE